MKKQLLSIFSATAMTAMAQLPPCITSWSVNMTNQTGYNNIVSNVQQVQYSTNNVYVSCSCIPGYSIGPWPGNPNTASNQNFVYKLTRNPQQNTGTPTTIGLGHIGVWINGVSIFNVSDGMSYNNAGVWNRNAYFWEGSGFDNCLGHPQQSGEYHNHVSPKCLYDQNDNANHSPIIGWAFDGYPVYGAYAFTFTNGTGPIKRMQSSYSATTTSTRSNGPTVSGTYPAGCFMEDYAYSAGSGDLDDRNGRFCVTPEFPGGTYAYFVTLDASLNPQFPYTFYKSYYGVVQPGNTGPNSGHNTVSESVTTYTPGAAGLESHDAEIFYGMYPNPAHHELNLVITSDSPDEFEVNIADISGKIVFAQSGLLPMRKNTIDVSQFEKGIYFVEVRNGLLAKTQKIVVN